MGFSVLLAGARSCCGILLVGLLLPLMAEEGPVLAPGGGILLADGNGAVPILVAPAEAEVVRIAGRLLAEDLEAVSGQRPAVVAALPAAPMAVLLGTLGTSPWIDALVARGALDATPLRGTWEGYVLAVVPQPLPGVAKALVVAGSDRRGTAYGALHLSRAMGVSPWRWWADAVPVRRPVVELALAAPFHDHPAVRYRGIFLNDEDWGLRPWAATTDDPEVGNLGPKTYARICELVLRLGGNCLWPAMHPGSTAFHQDPRTSKVADDYAIVMGSSHCEPMLRNNVGEWDKKTRGDYNYETNASGVGAYWRERVAANRAYENVYTLGMRGLHDGAMAGGKSRDDKLALMTRIIADQRAMLAELVHPAVERVPQIIIPYKEVLGLYQAGLTVPDDVTLVWPDDNHGYIRHFSTPQEQQRPGGAGVYYHASYWGGPADYLWLCTTPPALVWQEMSKAWRTGARTLWMLNVGDIKPAEITTEFFLRLAWHPEAWGPDAQAVYLADVARRTFGADLGPAVAALLEAYFHAHQGVRPEFLASVPLATLTDAEIDARLAGLDAQVARAEALEARVPPDLRDAYFQLVLYPIRGAALLNRKHLDLARAGRQPAALGRAQAAHAAILADAQRFNRGIAGGKWNRMMDPAPRKQAVFVAPPATAPAATPAPVPAVDRRTVDARAWNRVLARPGLTWAPIAGLGRSGAAVRVEPPAFAAVDPAQAAEAPGLEYAVEVPWSGAVALTITALPTHGMGESHRQRYAVAWDDETAVQVVDLEAGEYSAPWKANVLRGQAAGVTSHTLTAGRHRLRVYALDPGLVLDQFHLQPGPATAPPLFPVAAP